jgi:hypothetical protein
VGAKFTAVLALPPQALQILVNPAPGGLRHPRLFLAQMLQNGCIIIQYTYLLLDAARLRL